MHLLFLSSSKFLHYFSIIFFSMTTTILFHFTHCYPYLESAPIQEGCMKPKTDILECWSSPWNHTIMTSMLAASHTRRLLVFGGQEKSRYIETRAAVFIAGFWITSCYCTFANWYAYDLHFTCLPFLLCLFSPVYVCMLFVQTNAHSGIGMTVLVLVLVQVSSKWFVCMKAL